MIKKLTILTLMLSSSLWIDLYAQTSEKEITDEFFELYAIDPMEAFDYAFATNKWMERNQDAVDNLKNQFSNLLPLIGNYYGYDLIVEKSIGNNLKLASFMARYDRQPIRFTFILYKPNETWQVQNLKYDDKLGEEIEESAMQNRN